MMEFVITSIRRVVLIPSKTEPYEMRLEALRCEGHGFHAWICFPGCYEMLICSAGEPSKFRRLKMHELNEKYKNVNRIPPNRGC